MTSSHSLRGEDSFICFIYSLLTGKEGFVHCQEANPFFVLKESILYSFS